MTGEVLLVAAVTIAAVMLLTWIVSLVLRNASIVDPVWPLGFVAVAWVTAAMTDGDPARTAVLVALVTIWGFRLALHLGIRTWGEPEDYRYRAMRDRWGSRFWLVSLGTVFALQGVLMWVVSLPVQLGQVRSTPGIGVLAVLGVCVWLVGFVFETVGDWQLARFRSDPANKGTVMDRGLWRYTRHPNYFGDACVWWGIGLVAAETALGAVGLVGPVVMTILLRRVSGVTLLERSLAERREGYAEYVARTSPFLPRPPRTVD